MRIGVMGTGTIASAVVRGIAGQGHLITVSERSARHAQALAEAFGNVTVADNQGVIDRSDVVLLGLMAEVAADILAPLSFRPDQQVISMMAGATLGQVATMVAPAQAAAIMVPFPGIATGGSPVIAQGDIALVQDIVASANTVYAVDTEEELAAYLCAQAVLSPVARLAEDAAGWLGTRVADRQAGEAFLRHLISSSLASSAVGALVEALNTPGGYNQRLRLTLEQGGMRETLRAGLDRLESGE
ncbi:pyrroline-5-carboxylate reductase [Sulfitobacter alexandrii]|uniref:Pyrroline-5-carboxylate reductase n=2 Tax=Sulfitobacter alexandrii TaxID=1917485 RepID=A0A1J0WMJ5_9RHOB|nr:NAD(P)-binding domain-containing protein [Sulfitobacter alexandrii]APE45392.1 pyrroline-5-carboxylate reductase [Sulfitobacter alexandrii]